jgi:phosphotransferase system enzyme I (PtsI)
MHGRRITGRAASPGFAAGPLIPLRTDHRGRVPSGDPIREAEALRGAIASAIAGLEALSEAAAGEAAGILAFQVAMLSDPALSEGAFHAIEAGISADDAWRAALKQEIAGYESGEDEYFRARASDLTDLRDRVLDALSGASAKSIPPGAVVYAEDITPSRFLSGDWTGGAILLDKGSHTSHVAMLARAKHVPMIVGLGPAAATLRPGEIVLVDGASGEVVVAPDEADRAGFEARRRAAEVAAATAVQYLNQPARTRDGHRVSVLVNVADVADVENLDPALCDGVGLVRTELLFEGKLLPDEERQFCAYRRIAEWADGRPVTIRTLDAGGDKPIAGVTPEGESNPFLGVRGVRLTLRHRELFKTQLKALARAAAHGAVEVMLPMVTIPRELSDSRALLDEAVADLAAAGIPHRRPPLGMMVEVPAAAMALDLFDADFFSIGSNDLTQYMTAAARDIGSVADLADPSHPAVLRLIASVARHGAAAGRKVSLCGDAGGDPELIPALLQAGLRSLSVSPGLVAGAKAAIAAVDLRGR